MDKPKYKTYVNEEVISVIVCRGDRSFTTCCKKYGDCCEEYFYPPLESAIYQDGAIKTDAVLMPIETAINETRLIEEELLSTSSNENTKHTILEKAKWQTL